MTSHPEFLNQPAFKGKRRLYNVVTIEFRTSFLKRDVDARELNLQPGDDVIVETNRGPAIARVKSTVHRKVLPPDQVIRVVRKATEADHAQQQTNEELERQAYAFAISRIRERDLYMKLVRVQVMQDGSRIVFYFSSEGRVDFRDLVKDLAHHLRTRIEMHQIGVRDGTRMIGGIGPCGRELCCSTFLTDFAPVSIRMAKDQGLTLNPAKVSGMCGRLMCCLVYEQAVYKRMRKSLPRAGRMVTTPEGLAKVIEVDVINERVQVILEDSNRRTFRAADVQYHDPKAQVDNVDEADDIEVDYVWDDLLPDRTLNENRDGRGGRTDDNRSRRRRKRKPGESEIQGKDPRSGDQGANAQAGQKPAGQKPTGQKTSSPKPTGQKPDEQAKRREGPAKPPPSDGAPSDTVDAEKRRRRRRSRRGKRKGSDGGTSES